MIDMPATITPSHPIASALPTSNSSPSHSKHNLIIILVAVVGGFLLMSGLFLVYRLTQSDQDVRQQASTGSGTATVSISPTTAQINTNASQIFTVSFNPQGESISGISVRLQFPIANNQTLLTPATPIAIVTQSDQNWNCPVTSTENTATMGVIDVGCIFLATTGFTSQSNVPLFTVSISAGTTATTNPITLSFDPVQTVITRKRDNQDVAAIPQSVANITIVGSPSATPTPTRPPSPTATTTPTPGVTTSPTHALTPTPTSALLACNHECLANRDCSTGLTCISGRCLSDRCPADTTCACLDYDPTVDSGSTQLPDSGSISETLFSLILGIMLLIGSGSVLVAQISRQE